MHAIMNTQGPHNDPAGAFYEAIAEAVIRKLEERQRAAPGGGALFNGEIPVNAIDLEQLGARGLELMRAYTAKEVAEILGTPRVESVYEIPEAELPRVRRVGKGFGYLGINVLCYMAGQPPIDLEAAIEAYRQRLNDARGNILPMSLASEGLTRVL
ncbi:MAG: hypothetical protein SH809_14645 [Rhodothermales bacterium]|nr:hypothetical protein [Rhodothermales bacterium]MDZ4700943.1 hypothetical protein [Rhodothermales bacterium]